jgi:hypothetical protein
MSKKKTSKTSKSRATKQTSAKPGARCGLCGKAENLTKTECCGNWICDDEHTYRLFSYAHNSCSRNHRRYTLCGYHFNEGHADDWKDCPQCRDSFETEMYVYYGTNKYNFEKLPNPPIYEPTKCADCGKVISLGYEGHSTLGDQYWCDRCTAKRMQEGR